MTAPFNILAAEYRPMVLAYPGYVKVNGVSPGTYTLKYRDPNGTIHAIGPVVLPSE